MEQLALDFTAPPALVALPDGAGYGHIEARAAHVDLADVRRRVAWVGVRRRTPWGADSQLYWYMEREVTPL